MLLFAGKYNNNNNNGLFYLILLLTLLVLLLWMLFMGKKYFLRKVNDPLVPKNPNIFYSPCQGTVSNIIYNKGTNSYEIQIFLGLNDIHYQYIPIKSKILDQCYKKGKFHPAYLLEKSKYNERLETTLGMIEFDQVYQIKQIAGQIARRIETYVMKDRIYSKGEELGLIKFGSRVDIIMPAHNKLMIKKGNKVYPCKTPLFWINK